MSFLPNNAITHKLVKCAVLCATVSLTWGCFSREYVSADQCANPKLLRTKVSNTVFDFPKSVGTPHSKTDDPSMKNEKLGILKIGSWDVRRYPGNRSECNSKTTPLADFKDKVGFVFYGDGTEPKEYRMGDQMYSITAIRKYMPDSKSNFHSKYLADVDDIERVRFVGAAEVPPVKGLTGRWKIYEFASDDRRMKMDCALTSYKKPQGDDNTIPSFPHLCRDMTFRSGDLLISVGQRTIRQKDDDSRELIPPSEWPRQWAFTTNKVLSYRDTLNDTAFVPTH